MILQNDSISAVRDAVRHWVVLLSERQFDQAAIEIDSPTSPCPTVLLVDAIGRYSRKYREATASEKTSFVPQITSPFEMDDMGENLVMYVKHDSTVIEYDLPVDKAWSDLTAKFQLTKMKKGQCDLSLLDIRVL